MPAMQQVGRIRREAFRLHIGEHWIDLDELHCFQNYATLRKLVRALRPPITEAEHVHICQLIKRR
jgi:hypothetical protein